jgi:hypothetical protein
LLVNFPPALFWCATTVLLCDGCTSVAITPASVRAAKVPTEETRTSIQRWESAVRIANHFLESPYRRTMPAGKFTLDDDGMRFQSGSADHTWPVHVRYDVIGQVCVKLGFAAQERTDGFAVGKVPPHRSTVIDNSFFRSRDGKEQPPHVIAGLILHEATHQILRDGTVDVPKSVAYYAEAVFLLRSRTLTAERRPYATSEEFDRFLKSYGTDAETQARMLREFEEHLAQGPTKWCRHGPFELPVRDVSVRAHLPVVGGL